MLSSTMAEVRNVILVGFMGTGKSTVGRLLARRLALCFVETDDMITAQEGKPIPAIFAESGEPRFRELEGETLELLEGKQGDVIATGGGFPCRPEVMERLRALGTVVWLSSDFAASYERASRTEGRPMLTGRTLEQTAALFDARRAYYSQAHLAIDTTHLGVDQVVSRIARHLRERERARPAAGRPRGGGLSAATTS